MPCLENSGEVIRRATEDDIVNISKEMGSKLQMGGEGGEGFGNAFTHGEAEGGCGQAFTLEYAVSDGKGVPFAIPDMYI